MKSSWILVKEDDEAGPGEDEGHFLLLLSLIEGEAAFFAGVGEDEEEVVFAGGGGEAGFLDIILGFFVFVA